MKLEPVEPSLCEDEGCPNKGEHVCVTTKTFPTEAVLTITTTIMLTTMENVYKVLNHLSGFAVYTHQIPDLMRHYGPLLEKQFPQLVPEVGYNVRDDWSGFLDHMIAKVGPYLDVPEMHVKPLQPTDGLEGVDVVTVVVGDK